jgi:flagellar hook-basal body complex protein FliE
MAGIEGLLPLAPPHAPYQARAEFAATEVGDPTEAFGAVLSRVVGQANDQIQAAQQAAQDFAAGQRDDIHGTMLALSKANIELRLVGSMRNKIVDAFYELWRMQV